MTLSLISTYFAYIPAGYIFVYMPLRFIYRLYFDPLSNIPGPKLPLISDFATQLFTLITGQQETFVYQVREWHERYGPIIRVSSTEVHINDIDSFNTIFKVGTKFGKSQRYYDSPTSTGQSLIDLRDFHAVHLRRSALQPYFSKNTVRKLEGLIQSKVDLFLNRLTENLGSTVNLSRGFRCVTADIITTYSYEKCFNALHHPTFSPDWMIAFEDLIHTANLIVTLPRLVAGIEWLFENVISKNLAMLISPNLAHSKEFEHHCKDAVFDQKKRWLAGERNMVTVFEQLFQDDEKKGRKAATDGQLTGEAFLMVAAGMDTTGHALTIAAYNLIKYPEVEKKLLQELRTVMPELRSEVTEEVVQSLPFLHACIKESLRFSLGVAQPLARDVPVATGATILGHQLPPGTITMNSNYIYHMNPKVFPNPEKWDPERWFVEDTKEMENYFMPFSRGARICIGLNLAWAELSLVLAKVVRRFELAYAEDFKHENMEWGAFFIPATKGMLTVTVKERTE
ncbi:hypothetical protein AA313_de0201857 [Arthrobotrys entomopaga]|nr:hypothetical protein AA313_de0201857 [Arthrobotrys entomopaga]